MTSSLTLAELNVYADAAVKGDGAVSDVELLLFPYYDTLEKANYLAAVYRGRVTTPTGSHTVMMSYRELGGEAGYGIWCGDKHSEGRIDAAEAKTRCVEAYQGLANAHAGADEMFAASYAKLPESTACNFWTLWRKKEICKHVKTFLHHMRATNPNFATEMAALYQKAASGTPVTGAPSSKTYQLEELAFRVPVLFEGDRGAGKTHGARAFSRQHNLPTIECPGHEGIEAPDLLGFLVPYGQGQMVWKDGPLSEAFRKAQKGRTMLILDEILRIPVRELSILLTAFSPDQGMYRLRTGRITSVEDGVANEETLECPVENLCVVATTNVGAEYAVDEIDPALAERFVVIRKDTTATELKRILTGVAKAKGLSGDTVAKTLKFYKHMTEAMERGLVKNVPTTRTLARAFELALVDADVCKGLRSQVLLWVARTSEGKPVPEQLKQVESIIERDFA